MSAAEIFEIPISVPIGLLMGRQGENLRLIREKTNTWIQFSRKNNWPILTLNPKKGSKALLTPEQIQDTKDEVEKLFKDLSRNTSSVKAPKSIDYAKLNFYGKAELNDIAQKTETVLSIRQYQNNSYVLIDKKKTSHELSRTTKRKVTQEIKKIFNHIAQQPALSDEKVPQSIKLPIIEIKSDSSTYSDTSTFVGSNSFGDYKEQVSFNAMKMNHLEGIAEDYIGSGKEFKVISNMESTYSADPIGISKNIEEATISSQEQISSIIDMTKDNDISQPLEKTSEIIFPIPVPFDQIFQGGQRPYELRLIGKVTDTRIRVITKASRNLESNDSMTQMIVIDNLPDAISDIPLNERLHMSAKKVREYLLNQRELLVTIKIPVPKELPYNGINPIELEKIAQDSGTYIKFSELEGRKIRGIEIRPSCAPHEKNLEYAQERIHEMLRKVLFIEDCDKDYSLNDATIIIGIPRASDLMLLLKSSGIHLDMVTRASETMVYAWKIDPFKLSWIKLVSKKRSGSIKKDFNTARRVIENLFGDKGIQFQWQESTSLKPLVSRPVWKIEDNETKVEANIKEARFFREESDIDPCKYNEEPLLPSNNPRTYQQDLIHSDSEKQSASSRISNTKEPVIQKKIRRVSKGQSSRHQHLDMQTKKEIETDHSDSVIRQPLLLDKEISISTDEIDVNKRFAGKPIRYSAKEIAKRWSQFRKGWLDNDFYRQLGLDLGKTSIQK
ncbi:hypothetical protein G9A89_008331 [Geosiphon pyriformis]|nr:hypothetical protein G9A89_008331 [Geosiphon pyriformis]